MNIQWSHFFSSWRDKTRFERILVYLSYGVIIRDKLGNFGQFNDKTLLENESNLHTKISFAHNISRWTHNVRPLVSLPAVQWSTHSIFTWLTGKKLKYDGQIMFDAAKLITLVWSQLGRDWKRGQLPPHGWEAKNFWSYKLCLTRLTVRRRFVAAVVFFAAIVRRDGKIERVRERANRKFFSHDKDAVNFGAACCGQGVLEFSYLCTKVAELLPDWRFGEGATKSPSERKVTLPGIWFWSGAYEWMN